MVKRFSISVALAAIVIAAAADSRFFQYFAEESNPVLQFRRLPCRR